MKSCSSCKLSKEKSDFPKNKQNPDGLYAFCKDCKNARSKKAWAGDVGLRGKDRALKKNYGISLVTFNAILETQGGHCALCPRDQDMCLDHDHETKKIRGILCRKCNLMLGHGDDDATRMRAAATYLEKHQ